MDLTLLTIILVALLVLLLELSRYQRPADSEPDAFASTELGAAGTRELAEPGGCAGRVLRSFERQSLLHPRFLGCAWKTSWLQSAGVESKSGWKRSGGATRDQRARCGRYCSDFASGPAR